ncbi:MAG: hypothetical protein GYB50_25175 [Rhodobacteraceae bacterium]|nr:hypothetical protein [Paracoccaceae bacterium]
MTAFRDCFSEAAKTGVMGSRPRASMTFSANRFFLSGEPTRPVAPPVTEPVARHRRTKKEVQMDQSSEAVRQPKRPLLLGNRVRQFIKRGGRLRYEPHQDPANGKTVWVVMGVFPDETEEPVFTTSSGEHKHFRSADAMIQYHSQMCPDEDVLIVPMPTCH